MWAYSKNHPVYRVVVVFSVSSFVEPLAPIFPRRSPPLQYHHGMSSLSPRSGTIIIILIYLLCYCYYLIINYIIIIVIVFFSFRKFSVLTARVITIASGGGWGKRRVSDTCNFHANNHGHVRPRNSVASFSSRPHGPRERRGIRHRPTAFRIVTSNRYNIIIVIITMYTAAAQWWIRVRGSLRRKRMVIIRVRMLVDDFCIFFLQSYTVFS